MQFHIELRSVELNQKYTYLNCVCSYLWYLKVSQIQSRLCRKSAMNPEPHRNQMDISNVKRLIKFFHVLLIVNALKKGIYLAYKCVFFLCQKKSRRPKIFKLAFNELSNKLWFNDSTWYSNDILLKYKHFICLYTYTMCAWSL